MHLPSELASSSEEEESGVGRHGSKVQNAAMRRPHFNSDTDGQEDIFTGR